jgi:hypothetical protein
MIESPLSGSLAKNPNDSKNPKAKFVIQFIAVKVNHTIMIAGMIEIQSKLFLRMLTYSLIELAELRSVILMILANV